MQHDATVSSPLLTTAPDMNHAPSSRLWIPLLLASLGACTTVGGPDPGPAAPGGDAAGGDEPLVARAYAGQLTVQGSALPVVLSLRVRGEEVEEALLSVPELDMEARGDGRLRDGRLELELEYGGACAGEVEVDGELADAGHAFQGILTAEDCTGEEEGALVLRLRSGAGSVRR